MSGQQHAPAELYLRERPGSHFTGGWVNPRAENLVPTGIRSRTVQPVVSRYTDWAARPTFLLNRTIKNWNQLPGEASGTFPSKCKIFRKRVREVIRKGVKRKDHKCGENSLKLQWSELRWSEVKCSDVRWSGAVGNWNGVKPNERVVKCSWVKFK